jgi:hypothetical protein
MLQMLPLALEQAGAYIARQELLKGKRKAETSLAVQYMEHYERNAKNLLNNKVFQNQTIKVYENTTFVTWINTFQKIRQEPGGELANLLIEIIAYMGSDAIPLELLRNFCNTNLAHVGNWSKTAQTFPVV